MNGCRVWVGARPALMARQSSSWVFARTERLLASLVRTPEVAAPFRLNTRPTAYIAPWSFALAEVNVHHSVMWKRGAQSFVREMWGKAPQEFWMLRVCVCCDVRGNSRSRSSLGFSVLHVIDCTNCWGCPQIHILYIRSDLNGHGCCAYHRRRGRESVTEPVRKHALVHLFVYVFVSFCLSVAGVLKAPCSITTCIDY